MDIPDSHNHCISVPLRHLDIWDISRSVDEIKRLREFIDELTEWQHDMYTIRYKTSGGQRHVDIWFKEEKHAAFFALRWS